MWPCRQGSGVSQLEAEKLVQLPATVLELSDDDVVLLVVRDVPTFWTKKIKHYNC